MTELVRLERLGAAVVLTLDDPRSLNALTPAMIDALNARLDDAMESGRAILLRGEGRAFCSGFNIGPDLDVSADDFDAGLVLETRLNALMLKLRSSPAPIVAEVGGAAVGAGAALALSADLVVAAQDAYFLQAFRHVGLTPDCGASWLLARTIGRVRALELLLLGERLSAGQALDWGLVNRVVPREALSTTAEAFVDQLAKGPPRALARTREAVWAALESPYADQLDLERRLQAASGRGQEFREGLKAFREKRPPRFLDLTE